MGRRIVDFPERRCCQPLDYSRVGRRLRGAAHSVKLAVTLGFLQCRMTAADSALDPHPILSRATIRRRARQNSAIAAWPVGAMLNPATPQAPAEPCRC